MFYSVSALMCLYGFSTSKHSGMLSNFNKEVANKGLINKEYKDFYREMFDKRQKGDYDVFKFSSEEVKEWLDKAEDFINVIETLTLRMINEDETGKKEKNGRLASGFTLIELVMTILLIGILSVGLYEVVMWGINDYMTNERYLHSNNSMTQAMATIRRNLENAATPTQQINPACRRYRCVCPFNSNEQPTKTQPICIFSSGVACSNNGTGNEIAFYQNIAGTTNQQQLVVFCVNNNNNVLYEEITKKGTGTTSYPIANNITGISF